MSLMKISIPDEFVLKKKHVFVLVRKKILISNRCGEFVFSLTMPVFLIPNFGLWNMCIQNNQVYVSSETNMWVCIFELHKENILKQRKKKKIAKVLTNIEIIE